MLATKKAKPSKKVTRLLAVGCLLTTSAAFIHVQWPGVPDFVIGITDGIGVGILISALIVQRKERIANAAARRAE